MLCVLYSELKITSLSNLPLEALDVKQHCFLKNSQHEAVLLIIIFLFFISGFKSMELPQALTQSLGALANIKISPEACHLGSQLLVDLKANVLESVSPGRALQTPCTGHHNPPACMSAGFLIQGMSAWEARCPMEQKVFSSEG